MSLYCLCCVYWCDDVPVLATGQWERARVKLSGHQWTLAPAPRLQPNSGPALRISKQRTINPVCCCSVRAAIMINCIGGLLWHKCAPRRVSVDYSQLTNNGFIERDVQLLVPLWCGHQPGGDSGKLEPSHISSEYCNIPAFKHNFYVSLRRKCHECKM